MDNSFGGDYTDKRNKKANWQQDAKKRNNKKEERLREEKIQNRTLQRNAMVNPREERRIKEEYDQLNNQHLLKQKLKEEHKSQVARKNTHQNGTVTQAKPAAKGANQAYLSFLMQSLNTP